MFFCFLSYLFFSSITLEGWSIVFILFTFLLFVIHLNFDTSPTLICSLLQSYLWISKMRSKGRFFVKKKNMQSRCFTVRPELLVVIFEWFPIYTGLIHENIFGLVVLTMYLWVLSIIQMQVLTPNCHFFLKYCLSLIDL